MSFTLSPYKILASAIGLLIIAAVACFAGWHIRGWHDDAAQLKVTKTDISQMAAQFNNVITADNKLAATIEAKNQVTDESIAGLTLALGTQNHALTQIQLDIKSIPVGTCQFTPDADGLYQRAYQAAFGAPANPSGGSGKAGVGHAGNTATTPSGGHQ